MADETIYCTDCFWNDERSGSVWTQEKAGVCPQCGGETVEWESVEYVPEKGDRLDIDGCPSLTVTEAVSSRVYRLEGDRGGEYRANLWRNDGPLQPWEMEVWRVSDSKTLTDHRKDAAYKGSPNYRLAE